MTSIHAIFGGKTAYNAGKSSAKFVQNAAKSSSSILGKLAAFAKTPAAKSGVKALGLLGAAVAVASIFASCVKEEYEVNNNQTARIITNNYNNIVEDDKTNNFIEDGFDIDEGEKKTVHQFHLKNHWQNSEHEWKLIKGESTKQVEMWEEAITDNFNSKPKYLYNYYQFSPVEAQINGRKYPDAQMLTKWRSNLGEYNENEKPADKADRKLEKTILVVRENANLVKKYEKNAAGEWVEAGDIKRTPGDKDFRLDISRIIYNMENKPETTTEWNSVDKESIKATNNKEWFI